MQSDSATSRAAASVDRDPRPQASAVAPLPFAQPQLDLNTSLISADSHQHAKLLVDQKPLGR